MLYEGWGRRRDEGGDVRMIQRPPTDKVPKILEYYINILCYCTVRRNIFMFLSVLHRGPLSCPSLGPKVPGSALGLDTLQIEICE